MNIQPIKPPNQAPTALQRRERGSVISSACEGRQAAGVSTGTSLQSAGELQKTCMAFKSSPRLSLLRRPQAQRARTARFASLPSTSSCPPLSPHYSMAPVYREDVGTYIRRYGGIWIDEEGRKLYPDRPQCSALSLTRSAVSQSRGASALPPSRPYCSVSYVCTLSDVCQMSVRCLRPLNSSLSLHLVLLLVLTLAPRPLRPSGEQRRSALSATACYLSSSLFSSTTGKNRGKKFWKCEKDKEDEDNCNFFVWDDKVEKLKKQ